MTQLPAFNLDADTAVIVVDVQNDFASPEGNLAVDDAESILPVVNRLISDAIDAEATIIYTQDWHPERTPHFDIDGGVWPVHCVQGTWGADFHRDLQVDLEAVVVKKGVDGSDGYSGFSVRDPVSGESSATELGNLLEQAGARRLVIVGLAGDVCVKETALDGRKLGWDVVVPLSATRFVELEQGDGQQAIDAMQAAGVEVIADIPQ
ncbi:MAG: isochorismatase family protein [Nitriliruptoraceae bacterium]